MLHRFSPLIGEAQISAILFAHTRLPRHAGENSGNLCATKRLDASHAKRLYLAVGCSDLFARRARQQLTQQRGFLSGKCGSRTLPQNRLDQQRLKRLDIIKQTHAIIRAA